MERQRVHLKLSGVVWVVGLGMVVGVVGRAGAVPAGEHERGGEPGVGWREEGLVEDKPPLGTRASWLAEHRAEMAWVCGLGGRVDLQQFWAELLAQRGLEMPRVEWGDYGPEEKVVELNTGPWGETLYDPVEVAANGKAGRLLYDAQPVLSWENVVKDKTGGSGMGRAGLSFVDR